MQLIPNAVQLVVSLTSSTQDLVRFAIVAVCLTVLATSTLVALILRPRRRP